MRTSKAGCVRGATMFSFLAAVVGGNSRTWFEFFWIPLIPFSKSRIWLCTICQWEMKQGDGPDPQPPQQGWGRPPPPHQPMYGQQHV
uniref:Zinc-ribbon 15 domain-containing protein n=1 Tax=Kwoniella dejecticola CBS 10117 TaxID=1296121 RepID=A0A1A6AHG3_9TREE|nr:uncharacterized protein I303_01343 [Kwoniella dejecticola CBS 10117]OBR89515.1 hypothetical protein I303_01343 [Kwoniella dejecticola CBS 10117]